eukprot:12902854-Prorocentrum_lima.AAC.1
MCNKYTRRNINTTGRPFSIVYPEVYESYQRTLNWALTAEEAYSDVEDKTQASAKRDAVAAELAKDNTPLTASEKNNKK